MAKGRGGMLDPGWPGWDHGALQSLDARAPEKFRKENVTSPQTAKGAGFINNEKTLEVPCSALRCED